MESPVAITTTFSTIENFDCNDPLVKKAIRRTAKAILYNITYSPSIFHVWNRTLVDDALSLKSEDEKIDRILSHPWISWVSAETKEDIAECQRLIAKYRNSTPDKIEYYLYYHGCDDIAILTWFILKN